MAQRRRKKNGNSEPEAQEQAEARETERSEAQREILERYDTAETDYQGALAAVERAKDARSDVAIELHAMRGGKPFKHDGVLKRVTKKGTFARIVEVGSEEVEEL